MYGENENNNTSGESEENQREPIYESYSSPQKNDSYVKPQITENSHSPTSETTSGYTSNNGINNPKQGNGDHQTNYPNYYYDPNTYYNSYRSAQQGYGNPKGYTQSSQYATQPQNEKSQKKFWLLPVAIILCFAMCFASFFVGLSMVLDPIGDSSGNQSNITNGNGTSSGNNGSSNDGASSSNGSQTENDPSKDTSDSDKTEGSPYLGEGGLTLEQLPSDSVYYTIPSVVAATQDTVVEITTEVVTTGSYWQQYVTEGAGSGVIIRSYSEKGETGLCGTYIITNNHVIDEARSITVTLRNHTKYPATLVATDPKTDLAVLHVNEVDLPVATMGTSDSVVTGETVVVIGNPLGSLGGSVSSGIISATERNISVDNYIMKLMQTTAAVNPGNSGGAMFDLEGKLIGIVNAKYSDEQIEGIGFAIPIDIAAAVAEDLINYGYVKGRPNHGITAYYGACTYANIMYVSYNGEKVQGLWASAIEAGSDAEAAGMLSYDFIASVIGPDGVTYTFTSAAAATVFFDSLSVGDEITVNVHRYTATGSSYYNVTFDRTEHSFTFTITEKSK